MVDHGNGVSGLIEAARDGDGIATNRLLGLYRNYLRYLARAGLDPGLAVKADPSDLVQDTLIAAFQGFADFRGGTEVELLAWLRQILARELLNIVRRYRTTAKRSIARERSIEEVLHDSSVALASLLQDGSSSPSKMAQQRERSVILADALAHLPADYEEVVRLRNLEQLNWEQTAERMGRSAGAVRQLWGRAIQRLAPLLEGKRL